MSSPVLRSLSDRLRDHANRRRTGWWVAVGLVGVAIAVVPAAVTGTGAENAFADPIQHTGSYDPFHGLATYLGAAAWVGAGVLGAFHWSMRRTIDRPVATLIGALGLLGLVLAVDDVLALHEVWVPNRTPLPADGLIGAYAVAGAALVWWRRDALTRTPHELLWLALFLLGASLVVDVPLYALTDEHHPYLEEIPKVLGCVVWLGFVWSATADVVTTRPASEDGPGSVSAPPPGETLENSLRR